MSAENTSSASSGADAEVSEEMKEFLKLKEFSEEEIAKHNQDEDVWIIIDARVYDITTFKHDHPGGGDVMMDVAGQDATEAFEDIFHSENAREQLPDLCIGRVKGQEPNQGKAGASSASQEESGGVQYGFLFVLLFLIAAAVYQVYFVQGSDDGVAADVAGAAASAASGGAGEL